MKPSVFNNPHNFSFKDMLAIAMCAPFLIAVFRFLWVHIPSDLDLIKTLVPVIITVLGGYFGQEVASSYFTRGNSNVYGNYGYNYDTLVNSTTSEQSQEESPI